MAPSARRTALVLTALLLLAGVVLIWPDPGDPSGGAADGGHQVRQKSLPGEAESAPRVPPEEAAALRSDTSPNAAEEGSRGAREVRFLRHDGAPLVDAAVVHPGADGTVRQTTDGDGVVQIPAVVKEVLVVSDEAAYTLADLTAVEDAVTLQAPASCTLTVVENGTGEVVAPVRVGLWLDPIHSDTWFGRPWATDFLLTATTRDSDADGTVHFANFWLAGWPVPIGDGLAFQVTPLSDGARRRFGTQGAEIGSSTAVGRPGTHSTLQLYLDSTRDVGFHFLGEPEPATPGRRVVLRLHPGGGVLEGRLDANRQARFAVPGGEESLIYDQAELDLGNGVWVASREEQMAVAQDLVEIRYDSRTLPLRGKVEGMPAEARYVVGTLPLDVETEGETGQSFPLTRVEWIPVDADGRFLMSSGWIGEATELMLADESTGRILYSELVEPGAVHVIPAPQHGTLRLMADDVEALRPYELVLRLTGGNLLPGHAGHSRPVELLDAGEVVLDLPVGTWDLLAFRDGMSCRLWRGHLRARSTLTAELHAPRLVDVEVAVTGTVTGPLEGASVRGDFLAAALTTGADGRVRARGLAAQWPPLLSVSYTLRTSDGEFALATMYRKPESPAEVEEFHFEEGILRAEIPSWLPSAASVADCCLLIHPSSPAASRWRLRFPESGPLEMAFPVGRYSAKFFWETAGPCQASEPVDVEVVPGGVTNLILEAGRTWNRNG